MDIGYHVSLTDWSLERIDQALANVREQIAGMTGEFEDVVQACLKGSARARMLLELTLFACELQNERASRLSDQEWLDGQN